MEYRNKIKEETTKEINKIAKQFGIGGFIFILVGFIGWILFSILKFKLINPGVYIFLMAAGIAFQLTAVTLLTQMSKPREKEFWMTIDEAFRALKSGQKVCHKNYQSGSYIYMEYDIIWMW
jgi:preprotein translocase subunit Sss1